ncbi:MAG: BUD32 protein kinase [Amphiamblys sp. WSBS2006]|nr:MAG: BUD32 protein kinase [Amphiamblys sp. WSBS2006]
MQQRGAEAVITRHRTEDLREAVLKQRVEKKYRHPDLDRQIRRKRTVAEARWLEKARRNKINVPEVFYVDKDTHTICMEYIEGSTVKEEVEKGNEDIAEQIGAGLAMLHNIDVIHGDLTTSNMIVRDGTVFFIDFGLGHSSSSPEDKAVDFFLFERVFSCTHQNREGVLSRITEAYSKRVFKGETILKRLSAVRARGRKRTMAR